MVHAIKLSLTWRAVGFAICLRDETSWFSLSWYFCFFPARGLVSAFGDQLTRVCLYEPQRMGETLSLLNSGRSLLLSENAKAGNTMVIVVVLCMVLMILHSILQSEFRLIPGKVGRKNKFGTTACQYLIPLLTASHSTRSGRFVFEALCRWVLVYCNNYRMSSLTTLWCRRKATRHTAWAWSTCFLYNAIIPSTVVTTAAVFVRFSAFSLKNIFINSFHCCRSYNSVILVWMIKL